MYFKKHCESLGINLRDSDFDYICYKLRMISESKRNDFLEQYVKIYLEDLEKINKNNYARHSIARHYANRFAKLYKLKLE